ncbi:glycosyltransferase [Desulfobacterota bacterium AH_259_B03_O07]|nr:glycosyltransferase [Desulfobacterota bacterium AH_259_B03_O07]
MPHQRHGQVGVTAVNIVLYELLRGLVQLGHEIVLQLLFNQHRSSTALSSIEEKELMHLRKTLGIEILPSIYPEQYMTRVKPRSRVWKLGGLVWRLFTGARIKDFYPAIKVRDAICTTVYSNKADAILTIWSPEGVAATHGLRGVPRIAYQGDIDFLPREVRFKDWALFSNQVTPYHRHGIRKALRTLIQRAQLDQFKRAHLWLMSDVNVIANVTASNANFYNRHGHTRSIYIRNTWSDPGSNRISPRDNLPVNPSDRTTKIIGHVGDLDRTGSTYGLKFLLVDLIPKLKVAMDGLEYQIHIIGGGEVAPTLKPWLRNERIIIRSYVKDLDTELRSSDMFLLLNNAGSYQAAFTRHILAWSMGLCLIVHANSKKAIPEIAHIENALVGSTPDEVAQMVFLAATDPDLNSRLRQGGRATYEKYFAPSVVAGALSKEVARVVAGS